VWLQCGMSNCLHCQAPIQITNRKEKKYCSDHCARRASEPGQCSVCSAHLPVPRYHKVTTCSRKCSYTAANRRKVTTMADTVRKSLSRTIKSGLKARWPSGRQLRWEGCSWGELIAHLRSFMPSGCVLNRHALDMGVDHIIPLSCFDLRNPSHRLVARNWRNLRIIPHLDNRRKCSKLDRSLIHPALLEMAHQAGVRIVTQLLCLQNLAPIVAPDSRGRNAGFKM
jgi:hypothetical protein